MDRFSISGKACHELSQLEHSLPRTHLIESCAKVLDANWTVTRTPGASEGAELPFEVLLRNEISNYVSYINVYYSSCLASEEYEYNIPSASSDYFLSIVSWMGGIK